MRYPIRAIHQIELTSRCNLRCKYCVHGTAGMLRQKVDMDAGTFELALRWARYFNDRHHHNELNLAGIGESTMHPEFVPWVHRAREVMGDAVTLVLATNGLLMDDAMAQAIAPARPRVYVSLHRPETAQPALLALSRVGILAGVSCDGALASTDWAGQVAWPVTTPLAGKDCTWVTQGKAVVASNGDVLTCSFDASGASVVGNVTHDLSACATQPWAACARCHYRQPARAVEAA